MSGQATLFAAQTALVENPPPPEPANTDHAPATGGTDLVCFSHLRWNFVYQRPQHLLTASPAPARGSSSVEEPVFGDEAEPRLESHRRRGRCHGRGAAPAARARCRGQVEAAQRALLDRLLARARHRATTCSGTTRRWRSPSRDHLEPAAVVYDCMDELSAFRGAPPALLERERELFRRADLVFTGGQSLYEAKRGASTRTSTPSRAASTPRTSRRPASRLPEPADQAAIPHPRLGYFGVIDERHRPRASWPRVADARPDWHFVHGRPGGEDRPRDACRGGPTSTTSAASATTSCRPTSRAGTSALMPFAHQRVDPLHQPDQDARVPRRPAGRWSRPRSATWCAPMARAASSRSPRPRPRRWRRSRRRWPRPARARPGWPRVDRLLERHVLGSHLGSDEGPDR